MRKSWDRYFMDIATQVATRATCDRKHVGTVLVRDKKILTTGYNGSLPGQPHCSEVGHMMENGHCVRTNHAEANAVTQAALTGVATKGATAYVTASPCLKCFQLLVSAGISRIVFGEFYRDNRITELASESKILLSLVPVSDPRSESGEWLDIHDATIKLNVHPNTIYLWAREGKLTRRGNPGCYEFYVRD